MIENIDEWVGDILLIAPVSTIWPAGDQVSADRHLGWGSKITDSPEQHGSEITTSTPTILDGQQEVLPVQAAPRIVEEASMEQM